MSDTPRTDALIARENVLWTESRQMIAMTEHARQIERELAAAIKAGESVQRDSNEMRRNLDSVLEINATLEAKLTYLRSQRAGQMGEKLYKLEKELAELREELRLRHEADVKASAYAKHDTSPQVSHTDEKRIPSPCDPNNPLHQVAAEMIASAFDKCPGGLQCMQTTTGCAKGTCIRSRPHPFSYAKESSTVCLICRQLEGHPLHSGSGFAIEVPLL